jgi:hypothetical protein
MEKSGTVANIFSDFNQQELRAVEMRVQARMAESVEELAAIIKDYAKRHRKLHERIADLEAKAGIVTKNKVQT